MSLLKFTIISNNQEEKETLLNVNHIVIIKPTSTNLDQKVFFYVRTTDGKKYTAKTIPQELLDKLQE